MKIAEHESELVLTKYTPGPYLTLTGELWGVYCEEFVGNWQHNSIALRRVCYPIT